MRKKRIGLLLILAAASAFAIAQIQMAGGKGKVLSTTDQQPVEGATVTMDCQRSTLHDAVRVRLVTTVTDKAGMYEFSFADVLGCDMAFVHAAKAGYVEASSIHVGYAYTSYRRIPQSRYLTPQADVVMLRLTTITPARLEMAFRTDGTPSPAGNYTQWYTAFFQASRIAQTEREKQFVRERYCENLPKLYGALTDADRAEVARYTYSFSWNGSEFRGKHDYDAEVVVYCAR